MSSFIEVFAAVSGSDITGSFSGTSNPNGSANLRKIIGIALNVVKIVCLGIAIIMITMLAIKYMTSSPEAKADIKKSAMTYFIGAIIMFGASGIINILQEKFMIKL